MQYQKLDSAFLQYLVDHQVQPGEGLPPLSDISADLGISVGKLREQLEVARSLGYVSVRPRVGIQREPFSFSPAILKSVLFSVGCGDAQFAQFSQLRQEIEASFWHEAVVKLTTDDLELLQDILNRAWGKLRGDPVHVPNGEHRQLHLTIFSQLENPFVKGLLEAYWDAYEASELTRYARYEYWLEVWDYHERIVQALQNREYDSGRQLLIEHFSLLPMGTPLTA